MKESPGRALRLLQWLARESASEGFKALIQATWPWFLPQLLTAWAWIGHQPLSLVVLTAVNAALLGLLIVLLRELPGFVRAKACDAVDELRGDLPRIIAESEGPPKPAAPEVLAEIAARKKAAQVAQALDDLAGVLHRLANESEQSTHGTLFHARVERGQGIEWLMAAKRISKVVADFVEESIGGLHAQKITEILAEDWQLSRVDMYQEEYRWYLSSALKRANEKLAALAKAVRSDEIEVRATPENPARRGSTQERLWDALFE